MTDLGGPEGSAGRGHYPDREPQAVDGDPADGARRSRAAAAALGAAIVAAPTAKLGLTRQWAALRGTARTAPSFDLARMAILQFLPTLGLASQLISTTSSWAPSLASTTWLFRS